MGTTKNIEMREYNRSDYNLLLPKTDSYTKEETLASYTKSLLKLTSSAVPDDAFLALFLGVDSYLYRVKVQLSDGTPVSGSTISGLSAITGQTLTTGDDGIVLGKSTSASVTINCTSPYIDQKPPAAQTITKTGTITDVTMTLENVTDMLTIVSSKTAKISYMTKTLDMFVSGGGGGGAGGCDDRHDAHEYMGGGGGGGYASNKLNESISGETDLKIVIGSGGAAVAAKGGDGGTTSISLNNITALVGAGGYGGGSYSGVGSSISGGAGNGNGGNPSKKPSQSGGYGAPALVSVFNDSSIGVKTGGGGGGAGWGSAASGGFPNGGAGGYNQQYNAINGGYGGGGGGGFHVEYIGTTGGHGGSGIVYLRFHF